MASLHYTSVGNLLDNNYNPNSNIEPNNFNDIYQGSNISYTLSLQSNGFQYLFVLDNGSGPQTLFGGPFTSQGAVFADFSDNQAAVDLSGSIRGDILRSGSGSDILRGGDGNDTLEGGAGTNTLDGGTGVNTVSYEHYQGIFPGFPIGVTVDLSNGTATDGAFPIFAPSFTARSAMSRTSMEAALSTR